MSSKGQVIIPQEMRKGIKRGEKLAIIKNRDQLIMKKVKDLSKNLEEDMEFARRTEEAWKRMDKGEFTSQKSEDFLNELEKWAKE